MLIRNRISHINGLILHTSNHRRRGIRDKMQHRVQPGLLPAYIGQYQRHRLIARLVKIWSSIRVSQRKIRGVPGPFQKICRYTGLADRERELLHTAQR